jgi:hypothetical protein
MAWQDPYGQPRFRVVQMRPWQIILAAAVVLALLVALALVAGAVFLIAFPILFVGGLIYRFLGGRKKPPVRPEPAAKVTVIEGEYEIIPPERSSEKAPGRDGF